MRSRRSGGAGTVRAVSVDGVVAGGATPPGHREFEVLLGYGRRGGRSERFARDDVLDETGIFELGDVGPIQRDVHALALLFSQFFLDRAVFQVATSSTSAASPSGEFCVRR